VEASSLRRSVPLPRSRRLLAKLGDERLAREAQRGNHAAFETLYDRYHRPLLSFCRHMLGSRDDAEDALQQTFASAYRALPANDRPEHVKPWLYTIARNRCLSTLRARREEPAEELEHASTGGLSEEVERRSELRELLADVEALPERQRAALLLAEVSDLSHRQVADVLDCEPKQVKSLVFQARSALLRTREARDIPCAEIREEIATASGRDLRRAHLRRHVRVCEGCAEFEREVRQQRAMLALVLPVVPSLGLKESALAAAGIGGTGGGGIVGGGGGGLAAAIGAQGASKIAAMAIATGGVVGGVAATDPDVVNGARDGLGPAAVEVGKVVEEAPPEARRGGAESVGGTRSSGGEYGEVGGAKTESETGSDGSEADGSEDGGRSRSAGSAGRGRSDTPTGDTQAGNATSGAPGQASDPPNGHAGDPPNGHAGDPPNGHAGGRTNGHAGGRTNGHAGGRTNGRSGGSPD
jgi:RNA polymerase sigma factor (sigma-70 family)